MEFKGLVEMRLIDLHDDIETHAKIFGITHVIQLINSSNPVLGNQKIVSDINSNLIPHVNFISSCISAGVSSFTFLSSGGTVYGTPRSVPIREDHPTLPLNSYGLTKLFTEQYLRVLCANTSMGFNILRVANPFGPGQLGDGGQGLIGTILQKYKNGEALKIIGDGRSERDYLYIDDAVDAIVRSLGISPINDVINIGSGQGRSVLEVLSAVEDALGACVLREHVADRSTDASSNILDPAKAKRLLDWETFTPFDVGVKKTVEWNLSR